MLVRTGQEEETEAAEAEAAEQNIVETDEEVVVVEGPKEQKRRNAGTVARKATSVEGVPRRRKMMMNRSVTSSAMATRASQLILMETLESRSSLVTRAVSRSAWSALMRSRLLASLSRLKELPAWTRAAPGP